MLVVEINGTYRDETIEKDLDRQHLIHQPGWRVLRATAEDVKQDSAAVARGVTRNLELPVEPDEQIGSRTGILNLTQGT